MRLCFNCGEKMQDSDQYCGSCGYHQPNTDVTVLEWADGTFIPTNQSMAHVFNPIRFEPPTPKGFYEEEDPATLTKEQIRELSSIRATDMKIARERRENFVPDNRKSSHFTRSSKDDVAFTKSELQEIGKDHSDPDHCDKNPGMMAIHVFGLATGRCLYCYVRDPKLNWSGKFPQENFDEPGETRGK